jgi:hypothetical protein
MQPGRSMRSCQRGVSDKTRWPPVNTGAKRWIREVRMTFVFLVMGIICSCAESPRLVRHEPHPGLCRALAVSWLDGINNAETRYWLHSKKYAVLADLNPDLPALYHSSIDFHLADSDHYDVRLRCTDSLDTFLTDQTEVIRRCRPSEDTRDTCSSVDRLTLLAIDAASLARR